MPAQQSGRCSSGHSGRDLTSRNQRPTAEVGGLTCANGSSFWPMPTVKAAVNQAGVQGGPEGLRFRADRNQTGQQIGLKNTQSGWRSFRFVATWLSAATTVRRVRRERRRPLARGAAV